MKPTFRTATGGIGDMTGVETGCITSEELDEAIVVVGFELAIDVLCGLVQLLRFEAKA